MEERKWAKKANPDGVPVWSHDGMICTGEIYKDHVKLTFAKGASLKDPSGLFTSSLDGKVRRAMDIYEGEKVDEKAFKALIRAAVALTRPPRRSSRRYLSVEHGGVARTQQARRRGPPARAAPTPAPPRDVDRRAVDP